MTIEQSTARAPTAFMPLPIQVPMPGPGPVPVRVHVGGATHADPRLSRMLRFIDEHLRDPALGVDLLQSISHVSRPTLYRMFASLGGVSRYIRERRLLAAHRWLCDRPDVGITYLLYDLGFESERQFQRAFLAYFGQSPSQWRERCRARQVC